MVSRMPNDEETETIVVAFRRRDIRKVAEFCVRNRIPVVAMEKETDWEQILGKALDSPVLVEAVKLLDHYIEYKNSEKKRGKGKKGKVVDVDYEEVGADEDEEEDEDAEEEQ